MCSSIVVKPTVGYAAMPTPPSTFTPIHAFCDDALGSADATELAHRVKRGDVSARELTEAAIARAQAVDDQIRGLAAPAYERALACAEETDRRGPATAPGFFAGVPTAIKDNTDIAGLPTRHGSAAVPNSITRRTSPPGQQLLNQGFICLGKSTLPEFGFNASTEPAEGHPARNPWNPDYSTGASSGGSAALVAAGVVPVAHANDGGGSIRIPAACCGLVGLKPSRGRLMANDAAAALPINIINDGIVSRSVRDTANFMIEAERDFTPSGLPAIGAIEGPSGKPLTIGLVIDSLNNQPTDAETRAAVEHTARRLEKLGHRVVPVPIPVADSFAEDFALYWAFLAFGVTANGKRLLHPEFDKTRVDGLTAGLAAMFKKRFYRLPGALWRLKRSARDYARAMVGFDAVLTPVLGHTTPLLGHLSPTLPFDTLFERLLKYVSFTPLANATGAPAISLPLGMTNTHLPIGVQLMGQHGGERSLLDLAFSLEAETPWPLISEFAVDNQAGAMTETVD